MKSPKTRRAPVQSRSEKKQVMQVDARPVERDKYTVARFFSECEAGTRDVLIKALRSGFKLAARKVPRDGLPCIVILAAYARACEVDLVDDYDVLIDRLENALMSEGAVKHPDLFFASSCRILHTAPGRPSLPAIEGFHSIWIHEIYEELTAGAGA